MAKQIQNIKSALSGGGARPALFDIQITPPAGINVDVLKFQATAKTSQIPASTLGVVEVPYFGRKVKVAGDRTFAEWTVTIINDEDWRVRAGLENWLHLINAHQGNVRQAPVNSNPETYKGVATVYQYSKTGEILQEYYFYGLFPTEVAAIDVSWETVDTIQEFAVTFQYDHWERSSTPSAIVG